MRQRPPRIAAMRYAQAVTGRLTPWASRSRTSMPGTVARPGGGRSTVRCVGSNTGRQGVPGIDGLEDALLRRPELFVAPTEYLLTPRRTRASTTTRRSFVLIVATTGRTMRLLSLILGIRRVFHFGLRRAGDSRARSPGQRQVEGQRYVFDEEGHSQTDVPEKRAGCLALLYAMIPAATAWAQTPAKPVPRLGFVSSRWGAIRRDGPSRTGKLDELSPSSPRSSRSKIR
jgi:hypothetical protein